MTDLSKLGKRKLVKTFDVVKENSAGTKYFARELREVEEIHSLLTPAEAKKLGDVDWKECPVKPPVKKGGTTLKLWTCIKDGRRFVIDFEPPAVIVKSKPADKGKDGK